MAEYLSHTDTDLSEILRRIGISNIDELYDSIPEKARLQRPLALKEGLCEAQALSQLNELASENRVYRDVFRGAGAYRHYIPACVRALTQKEEFVTAYTPYQAEISQGILQAIFEYQSELCALTGMAVSNASVYDGATAAAEAVSMTFSTAKSRILLADTLPPQTIQTIRTYFDARGGTAVLIPHKENGACDPAALADALDTSACAVVFASPNYFGCLEDADLLVSTAKAAGVATIYSTNPIALALLKTPGECGADIAVGDGQPLGLSMSFGGASFGYLCCTEKWTRKLPGRIVGETLDKEGKRAFVLTLQAREQHIRREKALSNICSNEAYQALCASVYLSAMGSEGLKNAALCSMENARELQTLLAKHGYAPVFDAPFFHEFVTQCPSDPEKLQETLDAAGILGALPLTVDNMPCLLWCATELCDAAALHRLDTALSEVAK